MPHCGGGDRSTVLLPCLARRALGQRPDRCPGPAPPALPLQELPWRPLRARSSRARAPLGPRGRLCVATLPRLSAGKGPVSSSQLGPDTALEGVAATASLEAATGVKKPNAQAARVGRRNKRQATSVPTASPGRPAPEPRTEGAGLSRKFLSRGCATSEEVGAKPARWRTGRGVSAGEQTRVLRAPPSRAVEGSRGPASAPRSCGVCVPGARTAPPVPAQSPGAVEEILDRENKRMADSLASKVTRLKSLALDIDRDAEDQNRYLDGMDTDFTSMTSLLTGSVKRFSMMARSGRDNRKLLCGVAVGLIVAFFILSYFLSRSRT
uniref:BET1-like protein n=3 Tax=Equus asinus TaxID=9793 RepID=A0A9L0IIQ0_EQUAS